MPFYNQKCQSCDWTDDNIFLKLDEQIACPACGSPTEHYWKAGKTSAVIGDELQGGMGFTAYDTHLINTGRKAEATIVYSRSERRKVMKERSLHEHIDHATAQGTDKNQHTTNWNTGPAPGVDPRPSCMLNPEEQAARRAEWLATEPANLPAPKEVSIVLPEESGPPTSFADAMAKIWQD